MTDAEQDVIEFGEKVESLMKNELFQTIILDKYMREQAIRIGLSYDGDTNILEAITNLNRWLQQHIDDAKNIRLKG